MEELFEFEGQEYTLAEVQKAAEAKSLNIDDYIKEYNISRKPGKTTPTSLGADVEETAAPKLTATELPSVDTSLELPKQPQTGTSAQTEFIPEQTSEEELANIENEYIKVGEINLKKENNNKKNSKLFRFNKGKFTIDEREEYLNWKDGKGLFEESEKLSIDEINEKSQAKRTAYLADLPSYKRQDLYFKKRKLYEEEEKKFNIQLSQFNIDQEEIQKEIDLFNSNNNYSKDDFLKLKDKIEKLKNKYQDLQLLSKNLNDKNTLQILDDFKRDYNKISKLENGFKTLAVDLAMGPMAVLDMLKSEEGKKKSFTNDLIDYRESLAEEAGQKLAKPIEVGAISDWNTFGTWAADGLVNFIPSGLMASTGAAAMPLFFLSGFGSKMSDFALGKRNAVKNIPALEAAIKKEKDPKVKNKLQDQLDLERNFLTVSDATRLLTAATYGTAEFVFEIPTIRAIRDISNVGDLIAKNGFKKAIAKSLSAYPAGVGMESASEGLTTLTQNIADIHIFGDKTKSYLDGVDEASAQGALIGNGFKSINTGMIAQAAIRDVIATKSDKAAIKERVDKINSLTAQLTNKNLTKEEKSSIQKEINNEIKDLKDDQDISATRFLRLTPQQQQEVFEYDRLSRKEIERWNQIASSKNIDESTKDKLRKEIVDKINKHQSEKQNLLNSSDGRLKQYKKIKGDNEVRTGDQARNVLIVEKELALVEQHNKTTKAFDKIEFDELDPGIEASWDEESKTITINTALLGSNPHVVLHEYTHAIITKEGLSQKDFDAIKEEVLNEFKKKKDNGEFTDEQYNEAVAKYNLYKNSKDQSEELLTAIGEQIASNQIRKSDESFLSNLAYKIKQAIGSIVGKEEANNFRMDSAQDAFNFINQLTKSVYNKRKLNVATGGDPEKELEGKKESKLLGADIQKIYDEQGIAGAMDIIEAYKPLTTKLTNKYRDVPGFDFELLQSEIELGKRGLLDLIQAYTPDKGATLNTYVQGQLTKRAIEAANRILDTEFTLDVTEAKGVTDTTTEEVTERIKEDKPAERVSLRKQLGLDETIKPIVVNAVKKTFGTRLPEVTSKEFRPELEKRFRTELKKPLAKLMGRTEDYRSFLSNNFEAIYEAIPQYVINRRFNAFAEAAVDANGKPLREKTAEGKKIFTKKKIVKAEWLKYFLGDDVGRSTQGTRKTALAEALAEQFAYDATMEVLADPKVVEKIKGISELTGQKFVDNYLDEVSKAIERPTTFKFSLSTKIESDWVTDPLNPLSGDKKYNFTVGKIPFESKVFNEPDFEYEIFEGTFGIEDGTLADDPKSVLLAFSEKETGSTEILGTATQGLTSAFQVFGTVANSTIDLVKKEKLNSVAFTAKEKSRIRLYNALAYKFAKELGWDYYAFPLNEGETGFIAYDPKIIPSDENSNVSKDVIKFSKSTGVFDRDGNKVLFKDELGNVFDAVSKKIKLSPKTKFAFFEKEFLNYCKNNFKKGDGNPYNAKVYRSIAWEYYAGKQIEFVNPDLKLVSDFKGFSNEGIGDLEFLHKPSGKKIYAEVKLLNKKDEYPQMGSGGIVFDYDSDTFIKPKRGNPIEIFDYVVAVLKKEDYNNKLKKALDKLGIKNLSDLTPEMVLLFDKLKKELNITIPLGDATNIINSYAKKGVNLMVSGNDVSNLKIHSLDTNNFGLDIPILKGNGSLVVRAVYSNKRKGNVSLRVINTIKDVNEGMLVKEFKPVIKYSKSLSREFNQLLQATTGVEWFKTFSPAKARLVGKGKGKRKLFIPYSADDFVGLLYATLGRNKTGDKQMAWYEENLIRPFSRGIQKYESAKQKALREWMILKKQVKKDVPGGLNKANETGFTNQNSVRMYIWAKQGMEIPGAAKKDINDNVKIVNDNPALKSFAERLIALNPEGYPKPGQSWDAGDITTDLVSYINDVRRAEFLTEWNDNVKEIFNDANKEKLRALYGDSYIEALEDMLHRMKTGRNRKFGASKIEKQFMDWTNNSVGAIMFFNARSAVLQTLSAVNFINFSDNNPINAGIAFVNQKQYWKDFSTLFNSDFLKQRRTGLQTDVNSDEIANAAAGSTNKAKAVLSAILKLGFTPTQIADSFAIASGGATMYRNRIKKYLKEGLDQEAAEKKAFTDFQEIAEETQQSARPDRISMQQASSLGRLILAFGNTPMQYARLTKKAALDLVNGRGDWKTNISKIAYYSVIQNIIFSALQSGLFALLFDEEDEDKEKSRYYDIANKSFDTLLRGTGVYGAAASTVKNMILRIIEEGEKSRPDYRNVAITATEISPPINSKIKKLLSAGSTFTYKQSKEKVFTEGFSLENPAFLAAGKVISAGTNLPADRVVQKADHIYTAMQPETELWQAIALSLGWSEWDLGMIEKQTNKGSKGFKKLKPLKGQGFKKIKTLKEPKKLN